MESIKQEIVELNEEFEQLKANHAKYTKMVSDMKDQQKKCLAGVQHQKYRMKQINDEIKKLSKKCSSEEKSEIKRIQHEFLHHKSDIRDITETLPRENGLYLNIVLGQVNVSLLSKQDKFAYKQDYERFKLIVTIIIFSLSFVSFFWLNHRVLDAAFHFLLVWYYCTLTIREHILIRNGSRIKGWWLIYHFISTVFAGILLIWPNSDSYRAYRDKFMVYEIYINFVQFMQYYYQRGCLYKLRALGQRHSMDITIDGFMSWMTFQLSFLLPFLFGAYAFQLYHAILLYQISTEPYCKEWQVLALALIMFGIFFGNVYTTLLVIQQKISDRVNRVKDQLIQTKYRFSSSPCDSNCSKTE